MKHIWMFNKQATLITHEQMELARVYVASRKTAFADMLARVVFDDIERGNIGGTYYTDGRILDVRSDPRDLYAVGGGMPNSEIKLSKSKISSEEDVKAAIELLREAIVTLQADSDDPVGIGFWEYNGDYYFDVSNVVDGLVSAEQLARHRGEIGIYSFREEHDVIVEKTRSSKFNQEAWVAYNRRRKGIRC